MEKRWFGLGLGAAMSGRRKMGWRLGRGVGPMRSGGRKKKKNEREKRRAVAWVSGKWRKRWVGVKQGRWVD